MDDRWFRLGDRCRYLALDGAWLKLLKPRLTLSLLLAIAALCALTVHFYFSRYERQVLVAKKIEQLGGTVFYGWHNPCLEDSVWMSSSSRTETQEDGSHFLVPHPLPIPYKVIRTSPPDTSPAWSIFDFTTNWEIEYVELPDGKFTPDIFELLRTLPELRVVEVRRTAAGYYQSTEAESSQLRMVREKLPEFVVIYMYDHLLKRNE